MHWHVRVGPTGQRTVRINCFHYDATVMAMMIGVNPANASGVQPSATGSPVSGVEYLTQLYEGEKKIASVVSRS